MARPLWGVTLVVFMLLVSADRICCPDGCTDNGNPRHSSESRPHSGLHTCVLCVGVDTTDARCPARPVAVVSSVADALTPSLPGGIPFSLDHPPRRA